MSDAQGARTSREQGGGQNSNSVLAAPSRCLGTRAAALTLLHTMLQRPRVRRGCNGVLHDLIEARTASSESTASMTNTTILASTLWTLTLRCIEACTHQPINVRLRPQTVLDENLERKWSTYKLLMSNTKP
eukprot:6204298-Pleurochrysis_carterae.AAC.4